MATPVTTITAKHRTFHLDASTYVTQSGAIVRSPEYTAIDWPDGTILHVTDTDAELWFRNEWYRLPGVKETHSEVAEYWIAWCENDLVNDITSIQSVSAA